MATKGKGQGNTTPPAGGNTPPAKTPAPTPTNTGSSQIGKLALLFLLGFSDSGRAANRAVQDSLTALYRRGWMTIFGLIFVILFGYVCNLADMRWVNIFLLLIFNLVVAMRASRPDYLTPVAYTGAVTGIVRANATIAKGAEDFLKFYGLAVLNLQLYGSLAFVVLAHISFRESPLVFFYAVAVTVLILQIKTAWEMPGKLGKNFIYAAAIFLLIFNFALLIPEAWSVEKFGKNINPGAFFIVAEDKKAIYKIKKGLLENQKKANAESLEDLQKAIDNGLKLKDLSPAQKKMLLDAERNAVESSAEIKMLKAGDEALNWDVLNTFSVSPNTWTPENYGWIPLETIYPTEPIVIKVTAVGRYEKRYKDKETSPEYYIPVNIKTGIENFVPHYKDKLPLPNRNPGCGVVSVNGRVYALDEEITINGYAVVYFSINSPQNWNNTGFQEENFIYNKGTVEVTLKKRI